MMEPDIRHVPSGRAAGEKPAGPAQPVTLEGSHVRLEPLGEAHTDDLARVAFDPEIWRWTTNSISTRDELREFIELALRDARAGSALPFATIDRARGRAVGSTRFGYIALEHRRLEVGWTWLGRDYQRTVINTEAKYLMLRHAFEVLGVNRVELKTDVLNDRSRAAILRLGAKEEGILRKHIITDSGRVRDSVIHSILDDEWPAVRARLEARLAAPAGSGR
jgi:RimJ/RimL family protein N-acetyltransferase